MALSSLLWIAPPIIPWISDLLIALLPENMFAKSALAVLAALAVFQVAIATSGVDLSTLASVYVCLSDCVLLAFSHQLLAERLDL